MERRRTRRLLFAALLFVPVVASAESVCVPTPPKVRVRFLNGISNTIFQARDSARDLKNEVRADLIRVGINRPVEASYDWNMTAGLRKDLGQSVLQSVGLNFDRFLAYLTGDEPNPSTLLRNSVVAWMSNNVTASSWVTPADLDRMVERYGCWLDNGDQLVVVSHSQGNYYANAAHRRLKIIGKESQFGIVGVATPDSLVEGPSSDRYTTLSGDWIHRVPLAANANIDISCGIDVFRCHNFQMSYLTFAESHAQILGHVRELIGEAPHIDYATTSPPRPLAGQEFLFKIHGHLSKTNPHTVEVVFVGPGCPTTSSCVVPNNVLDVALPTISGPATLNNPGTYNVAIRNGPSGGLSNTYPITVVPATPNQPPTAGFSMTSSGAHALSGHVLVTAIPEDETIAAVRLAAGCEPGQTAGCSFDPDGGEIVQWRWSVSGFIGPLPPLPSVNVTLGPGTHTVTLVVKDDEGTESAVATGTIVVEEAARSLPQWSNLPNTGVGLADGAADARWVLASAPTCAGAGCAVVASGGDAFSRWLVQDPATSPAGQYVYRLEFNVPADEVAGADVQRELVDNRFSTE